MDSNLKYKEENEYPIYFYIHLFFVFIGIISYLIAFSLFTCYFKYFSFIKKEIFTFIILNSFKSFLEILTSTSLIKELIIYLIGCLNFYLLLSYINKCMTTKKLGQNTSSYELDCLYYILLIYIFDSFPYEKTFKLSGKYIFSYNTMNIILIILLFRYINIKMQLLLEYLKEKKMTNSSIPDIYLPYKKAHFYYNNFSIINVLFYFILVLSISYYIIKILDLFLQLKVIFIYLSIIFKESIYICIVISCFIFFYCLNKNKLIKGGKKKNKNGEDSNLGKFSVVDIDIQQDETTNLSERKRTKEKKDETKLDKEDENENDEEEEKAKENPKINEESETLK